VLLAVTAFASVYAVNRTLDQVAGNSDFAAYYCAGNVARVRADPYAAQPMEQCHADASNPAPLPGFAIALFSAISFAPYREAALGWDVLLLLAILLTVWATWRASGFPLLAVAAGVIGTDLVAGLAFGQISVLTACGVALTTYCLHRRWQVAAAFAWLLTLFQPQVGIPVAMALLFWSGHARGVVLALLCLVGFASYAHLGASESLEYIQQAVPVHAAAEVPLRFQYGLTWIDYFFGLDEARALQAGVIQYALTALFGVLIAPVVARRLDTPGVIAALPAAAAVLGGPSVHLSDLASALPFAAIVAASPGTIGGLGRVALVLLSAPWIGLLTLEQAAVGGAAAAITTFYALGARPWFVRAGAAVAILALTLAFPKALADLPNASVRPPPMPQTFASHGYDPALAATRHGLEVRAQSTITATSWEAFALKLPDWLGLLLILAAAVAVLPSNLGNKRDEDDEEFPAFDGS
jgi:hypothetical protein